MILDRLFNPFFSIIFNYYTSSGHPPMTKNDIMTIRELSDYLKIAEKTAYRFASEGKLPGFKVGSAWRFRKQEIDLWISEQCQTAIAQTGKGGEHE